MKISYNWLKKYINFSESPEQIGNILTDGGLEVEKIEKFETIKGNLEGIVIGKVLSCEKHPGADKLKKTTVDIGNDNIVPIVCGASNVAVGQTVVVATVGATLYPAGGEPFKISKAKIRGEVSEGMICAEDEIGLGVSHDGIIVLQEDIAPGTPASIHFKTETDSVFEIGLTPNRADAASHLGVARDLRALLKKPISFEENYTIPAFKNKSNIEVEISDHERCPRYCGVLIDNVQIKPSPAWLQTALKSIGIGSINNIVDVTNFILHDLGQPLHAFDSSKIEGNRIVVKTLETGTGFTSLDGVERKLFETDLIICDNKKPLAMAGVMGGKHSSVSNNTTSVFIESAYFSPSTVRKTSLLHGLKTESSFRYERGTDPEMPLLALKKAVNLMIEVAGGEVASETIDIYPFPVKNFELEIDIERIYKLIGKRIEESIVDQILHDLSIEVVNKNGRNWNLNIPSFKVDVQREADIAEEILRVYGYNNIEIPPFLSTAFVAETPLKGKDQIYSLVSGSIVPLGFFEIVTNSLTRSGYAEVTRQPDKNVIILNALSENLNAMRQNLLFSGLEVVSYNLKRQQKSIQLFEFGKVYFKSNEKYEENDRLAIFLAGSLTPENWQGKEHLHDFYNLKGIVQKILDKLSISDCDIENSSDDTIFEFGLKLTKNTKHVVTYGKIKKTIAAQFDIKQDIFYADFDAEILLSLYKSKIKIKELPKYPEVRRDLSLVLNKDISYEDIKAVAKKTERKLLQEIDVFDIYEGDKIESGKKAYAVSFILQDFTQTLTDKHIDNTMSKLIQSFEKELGAFIRK